MGSNFHCYKQDKTRTFLTWTPIYHFTGQSVLSKPILWRSWGKQIPDLFTEKNQYRLNFVNWSFCGPSNFSSLQCGKKYVFLIWISVLTDSHFYDFDRMKNQRSLTATHTVRSLSLKSRFAYDHLSEIG